MFENLREREKKDPWIDPVVESYSTKNETLKDEELTGLLENWKNITEFQKAGHNTPDDAPRKEEIKKALSRRYTDLITKKEG